VSNPPATTAPLPVLSVTYQACYGECIAHCGEERRTSVIGNGACCRGVADDGVCHEHGCPHQLRVPEMSMCPMYSSATRQWKRHQCAMQSAAGVGVTTHASDQGKHLVGRSCRRACGKCTGCLVGSAWKYGARLFKISGVAQLRSASIQLRGRFLQRHHDERVLSMNWCYSSEWTWLRKSLRNKAELVDFLAWYQPCYCAGNAVTSAVLSGDARCGARRGMQLLGRTVHEHA
jgi:hypothetical protein